MALDTIVSLKPEDTSPKQQRQNNSSFPGRDLNAITSEILVASVRISKDALPL